MRTWRWASVLAVIMLVLAACAQQAAPSGSAAESEAAASEPAASEAPPSRRRPIRRTGPPSAARRTTIRATSSEIRAEDERTVVFALCAPDVAFLSKVAFTLVRDQRLRVPRGSRRRRLDHRLAERDWPVPARCLEPGIGHPSDRVRRLLGRCAAQPRRSSSAGAPRKAQRLVELQSGTVDGIDNVGPTTSRRSRATPTWRSSSARA